jgi:hypothetical protein
MPKTTKKGLQERQDAPLILTTSAESFNATNDQNSSNPIVRSMSFSHCESGYNSQMGARMSGHSIFVLSVDGQPLTPCKPSKARKLLKGNQAKSIWNKFGRFGIQMLFEVGRKTPKTALGVDFGTKFEGYGVVVGKENNLSVMWKLPDKKKLVRKLMNRKQMRRAKRWRTCRRRQCKSDNREKDGFIAPSQLMMIQSRLKVLREFLRCYPIDIVAVEDVCFNHRANRWGKNFSTVEIGKHKIYDWIREHAYLQFYFGIDTEALRKKYGYKKSSNKGSETFNSHCSDALAIASDVFAKERVHEGKFIVVDDTYRSVRRQLHDTQFSKGGVRYPYSSGNFKGIRKGTICNFGQICGGIKQEIIRVYDWNNKRVSKNYNKLLWLSHNFKIKESLWGYDTS